MIPGWLVAAKDILMLGSDLAPVVVKVIKAIREGRPDGAAFHARVAAQQRLEALAGAARYSAGKGAGS